MNHIAETAVCPNCSEKFDPASVNWFRERDPYGTGDSPDSFIPVSPCCGEEPRDLAGDFLDPDQLPEPDLGALW